MKKSIKTVYKIPVCFISFLLLISSVGCSSTGKVSVMPALQSKINIEPEEREVVVAETRTIDKIIISGANVTYEESEDLFFEINNCKLKDIYIEKDELVEKGQLLAELDASDLEYQLSEKQIDLERLQLRYDSMLREQVTESVDSFTALEYLKLDMESIELNIAHLEDMISKTKLIAPFSGKITGFKKGGTAAIALTQSDTIVEPGTIIQAYEVFMTIAKEDSIILKSSELSAYGSSYIDLSGIVTGMKVEVIFGSNDTKLVIPATITEIVSLDPGIEQSPDRVPGGPVPFVLMIKPEGKDADNLKIGDSVSLRIKTGTNENVVVLPENAIQQFGNDYMIQVLKNDKVINRFVKLGFRDPEEDFVVITSGLLPGEKVILN